MDLEEEFVAALDDPGIVWGAVLNNLATGPQVVLQVFTTCTTPVALTKWQEAVARVSLEAAVHFEAGLRALDDTFVSIDRLPNGQHRAQFRNPSMDDFCAAHLDANFGVAVAVAAQQPSYGQIRRIIQLGTARRGGKPLHENIHRALIRDPSLLLSRLLELLPPDVASMQTHFRAPATILSLLGEGSRPKSSDVDRVRSALSGLLLSLDFRAHAGLLYEILDAQPAVRGIAKVLGTDFEDFYNAIWPTADAPGHFDSLVNMDVALGRPGPEAPWRDLFITRNEEWIAGWVQPEDYSSTEDYYNKVAEHLDLRDLEEGSQRWEEMRRGSESGLSPDDEEDESWRAEDDQAGVRASAANFSEDDEVDALFHGLVAGERFV